MKSLRNKILLGTALVLGLSGCLQGNSGNSEGTSDKSAEKTIPEISYSGLPSEMNEGTKVSEMVNATNEDKGEIYFFKEGIPWLNINKSTGVLTGTSPNVNVDTDYFGKILACNEDVTPKSSVQKIGNSTIRFPASANKQLYSTENCSSKDISTKVLNVAQELGSITNTEITGQCNEVVDFDLKSPNEGEEGVEYKTKFGNDASGDFSGLIVDPSTGVGSFTAACYGVRSGSLEATVGRDGLTKTKNIPINIGYKNPLTTNLTKSFDEKGNVTWFYDATSDESKIDYMKIDLHGNDFYVFENIDLYSTGFDLETPVVEGENSIDVLVRNASGDEMSTEDDFYVPNEAEFRSDTRAILDTNADKYQDYIEDGQVIYGGGDCGDARDIIKYDFKVTKPDGSKAYIAYEKKNAEILKCLNKSHLYQNKSKRETINSNTTDYVVGGF